MDMITLASVQFSRSVMSDSLRPYGVQHARLSYPSILAWMGTFSGDIFLMNVSLIFFHFPLKKKHKAYSSLNDMIPWKKHVQIIFC